MTDMVFDAGALIGIERSKTRMIALLAGMNEGGDRAFVPAAVLAQAWRGGAGQARLAKFLKDKRVTVEPLTEHLAQACGVLCGQSGTDDVVDASVVTLARKLGLPIVTGDEHDLAALNAIDPTVTIYRI
ncbi:MAG: hypothetical protein Q8P38_12125 [Candidatus Nanopelagicales bacterium]|nr:hypothetical protein [Candidatus Nanopelagicales bacterium]